MTTTAALDLNHVRAQFPALADGWVYLDNAGGSQTLASVANRVRAYLLDGNVQLGATYDLSQRAEERVRSAEAALAALLNAADPSEIVVGPSTTALLRVLATSFCRQLSRGDEIVVTNCDHEANIGPWLELERFGIVVRFWNVDPDTLRLEADDLAALLGPRTRLVAATHASNLLGEVNPVREWAELVHDAGALFCVDGVAYAAHRLIDVQSLGVDFYTVSLYKVFGPHMALLYGRREHLLELPRANHFFIAEDEIPYKLQPGNRNYELTYGAGAIVAYLAALGHEEESPLDRASQGHGREAAAHLSVREDLTRAFDRIAAHEGEIAGPLLEFLADKAGVRVIGPPALSDRRIPTVSFVTRGRKSSTVPPVLDPQRIGIRFGDFYARRLVDDLGLSEQDGVVRISMVHYNTPSEIDRLIAALDATL